MVPPASTLKYELRLPNIKQLQIVIVLSQKGKMKLSVVAFGVLVACAVSMAVEHGPVLDALHPQQVVYVQAQPGHRQKRHLLLGAGAGLLGAGLAAGAVGLGAGVIGAKAGLVGGALAATALHGGRSFGGYGYGGYGYGGYGGGYGHGYGYGNGYGHGYGGYRSYYPTTYYVSDTWC
ncbi:unnamed protein product [Leptosia nina]|uniref:Uncharacterized protein n=1 Tax=Leptosia nina TaxID=320188 RepID=A0AAV1ISP5_9NEOP